VVTPQLKYHFPQLQKSLTLFLLEQAAQREHSEEVMVLLEKILIFQTLFLTVAAAVLEFKIPLV
jgi:hypothetical protein